MSNAKRFNGLSLTSLAFAMALASPGVFAHTEIKSPITEGVVDDNAVTIGHGCETATGVNSVVAESVVFPSAEDHSDVIEQGTLAGLIDTIQDKNIFTTQAEKLDSLGNVIGFSGKGGNLATFTQGRVPFNFTSPNFVSTSCVKRLFVEVAVVDICKIPTKSADKFKAGNANAWVPDNGSIAAQKAVAAGNAEGVGFPAVLIINRDLGANPLAPSCGDGIDQTITPTAAEINANLPIPGYWTP